MENLSDSERRHAPRPGWLTKQIAFVRRHGVVRVTFLWAFLTVLCSTVLCQSIFAFFSVRPVGVALILPTLAPALIAPPSLYLLIRAIDLLGRAESGLEAQRERLETAVEIAQKQALKADTAARAKAQFLAHMSHELRTPLNAILGFSETIRDAHMGPIGSTIYQEYGGHIHSSGEHLLSLINDILDMSRIESGRMDIERAWWEGQEVTKECIALVEADAKAKNISLDDNGLSDDLKIFGDRRAVKQVLINLLSNAVKFTPNGGRVEIHGEGDAFGAARLTISDTGAGIAPGDLERIYEPFVRLEHAETGTGLGLPLAKGLVELHGGELTIESEIGHGTTVNVTFPGEGMNPEQPDATQ